MEERTVTCVGINGERTEVPATDLEFRPSVYGVIVRDDKVLLSSQWDGWDFPGGAIEPGETIDETFEREIKEETGLTAKRGELLEVSNRFFTHPNTEKHYQSLLMYYTCTDFTGSITTANITGEEKVYVREAQWIPLSDVAGLKFYNQIDSVFLINMAAKK